MELYDSNLSIAHDEVTGSVYYDGYSVEGVEAGVDEGSVHLRTALITMSDEDGEPVHGPINRADHSRIEDAVEGLIEEEWIDALDAGYFDFDDYDEHDWNDRRGYWP
mgnify:CR=1 FL=1